MSNPSFMPAWRWPRAVRCGRSSFALGLLLAFALSGCAPQTVAPLPPATSLAVTAAPPATAAPPTAALQPTRASQPTVKVPSQPTQTAQPAGNADLLLTVMHTNDVGGETDPCG